jgi:adenylyltransferase/sulfurtransferase
LPDIGEHGQRRLLSSHALIVGCGALGCAQADLLARAGVGTLTIVDRDVVELTNLQRQTLFDERDARDASPKADAAARRLRAVNSSIKIEPIVADFTHENAESILFDARRPPVGVILDGTDNLGTRYLLNDLAVKHALPYIYAGAVGTRGMMMPIVPAGDHATPCLRCLFPEIPIDPTMLTCDTAGILGPVVAIAGAFQVTEALKVLIGRSDLCSRGLVEFDPWLNHWRRIALGAAKSPDCPCCGQRNYEFLAGAHAQSVTVICTRNNGGAVQIAPGIVAAIDLAALRARLSSQGDFVANDQLLRGVLRHEQSDSAFPIELTVFRDGRTIVRGTTEPGVARAIHARYVGA